jgi:hypothetical protein
MFSLHRLPHDSLSELYKTLKVRLISIGKYIEEIGHGLSTIKTRRVAGRSVKNQE